MVIVILQLSVLLFDYLVLPIINYLATVSYSKSPIIHVLHRLYIYSPVLEVDWTLLYSTDAQ